MKFPHEIFVTFEHTAGKTTLVVYTSTAQLLHSNVPRRAARYTLTDEVTIELGAIVTPVPTGD